MSTSIKRQKVATSDYSVAFPWSTNLKALMKRVWGIESFRRNQEAVINATMSRRDVVCLMPTGGGKSLCFQAPALLEKGTTLVVTPLLSLMQDQIYNLRAVGVRAETIHGATSAADAKAILKRLVEGGVKQGKRKRSQEDVEIDEDEREVKLIYVRLLSSLIVLTGRRSRLRRSQRAKRSSQGFRRCTTRACFQES